MGPRLRGDDDKKRASFCLGLLLLLILPSAAVPQTQDAEAIIKAAYIFNFTKFVTWPSAPAGVSICANTEDALGTALPGVEKESSAERPLQVLRGVTKASAAKQCQIFYMERDAGPILAALAHEPVLTVGEGLSFLDQGGMIAFVQQNDRVKMVVNLAAAEAAGLKLDPQLLEIALEVRR